MPIRCRLLVMSHPGALGATKSQPALTSQEIPVDLHLSASHVLLDAMRQDDFVSHPVPRAYRLDGSYITGEEGERSIAEDHYGPLRYCYSTSFVDITLPHEEYALNKAALAYVLALPDDWPIILYWS